MELTNNLPPQYSLVEGLEPVHGVSDGHDVVRAPADPRLEEPAHGSPGRGAGLGQWGREGVW